MKQPKKLFTRMLLNNWGGISHKVLNFHEYVNLFSGKSGSGKSTVMDAIQVLLYGSVSANFLNKAADDSKNKRSVLSYLRGAQKDGTMNRGNMDFCSQIVLQIKDTGSGNVTCIGVVFEVAKQDLQLGKYAFFSHAGEMPENLYLENGVPYSVAQVRKLVEQRAKTEIRRGAGEVNRVYPSKEAYLNAVYDTIFGYVEPGRLMTMEKSAIALRMSNGTGEFIRDYMFPKSKEDTVSTISEQLGAYREIRERVVDLQKRISLLEEIHVADQELLKDQTEQIHINTILKHLNVQSTKVRLEARTEDLKGVQNQVQETENRLQEFSTQQKEKQSELIEVEAKLQASDLGQKEHELKEMERMLRLLSDQSAQWRNLKKGLKRWSTEALVTDYVSNKALQLLDEVEDGTLSKEGFQELKRQLDAALSTIVEELSDVTLSIKERDKLLSEKKEEVEDLRQDRKAYPKELRAARAQLQEALTAQYGRTVQVHILADLFDVTDEKWKNAIEGRLGRIKKSLVTEPACALDAARIFRKMKDSRFEEVDLINTAAIQLDSPSAEENSLYTCVQTDVSYVKWCLKRYLGRIIKCETVEELDQVRDGVTPDCYSYSNYMFRHLRKKDYTRFACIGTKVSKARLRDLEEEIQDLEEKQIGEIQLKQSLQEAQNIENLQRIDAEQFFAMAGASEELEVYYEKEAVLRQEIRELKEGSLIRELNDRKQQLNDAIAKIEKQQEVLRSQLYSFSEKRGEIQKDLSVIRQRLADLMEGFVENSSIRQEMEEALTEKTEPVYRRELEQKSQDLEQKKIHWSDQRQSARTRFNQQYPTYGFDGAEHSNSVYDQILFQCKNDYEPKYLKEFNRQYDMVYHSLRDNVIATIHGEIKAAYRHKREINRMLSKIRFSDSVYQIDVLPAQNENGQFYEMLMAEELDSKVLDHDGFDGQFSLGDDAFFQKYEQKIQLLTEKFMPLREEENGNREQKKKEMERFADYRNYLTFSMYERSVDESGVEKKNYVDDMAGVDSGGEGQNPKYVALLAGFAMLYMQQSSRDSKIRLVLLDEAFSKMDKERSEVCLKYARELELQLIVCVPDERLQSLIRNVDCVYGFRRHKNQVSMMHIDKGEYLEEIEGGNGREENNTENDTGEAGRQ